MSIERRESPRRVLNVAGAIRSGDGPGIVPCVVADVSATGAKLLLEGSPDVSDEFVLILSRGGAVRRHCRVVRRIGSTLGVRFLAS
jgi:hypothetical protein